MSDTGRYSLCRATCRRASASCATPPSLQIFLEFLIIGATSFGGVSSPTCATAWSPSARWLDDKEFVEMLSISQSLPGLNATNMAMLVGDRLRGAPGLARRDHRHVPARRAAHVCRRHCLPRHGDHRLGHRRPERRRRRGCRADPVHRCAARARNRSIRQIRLRLRGIDRDRGQPLHLSVPRRCSASAFCAILWHRPAYKRRRRGHAMNQIPALVRVFAYLSLLTVGGGMAAFPEMKDPDRRRPSRGSPSRS